MTFDGILMVFHYVWTIVVVTKDNASVLKEQKNKLFNLCKRHIAHATMLAHFDYLQLCALALILKA